MERVVYFLGAGFSAPLGLPVMSNFIEASKDQYFSDRERYAHFGPVFEKLRTLSMVMTGFTADMHNIEEVLSLLEIHAQVNGPQARDEFLRYVRDVIAFHTPHVGPPRFSIRQGNWWNDPFHPVSSLAPYAHFVGCLFRLALLAPDPDATMDATVAAPHETPAWKKAYSVISLNYDMVLENIAGSLHGPRLKFAFATEWRNGDDDWSSGPYLAKLHGSADAGPIIPPTWNKTLDDPIRSSWRLAYNLLASANEIRILGYSLPESDAYVRYLVKAAYADNPNLKRIDVGCMDPEGTVKRRYDSFIRHPRYRFRSMNVLDALHQLLRVKRAAREVYLFYDGVEAAHERVFGK